MKPLIAASVYPLKKGTRVSQEMNDVIYDLQGSDSVRTPHTFFFISRNWFAHSVETVES